MRKIMILIGALSVLTFMSCGSKKECGRCPYESQIMPELINDRA